MGKGLHYDKLHYCEEELVPEDVANSGHGVVHCDNG
jgi:hypothetical protein